MASCKQYLSNKKSEKQEFFIPVLKPNGKNSWYYIVDLRKKNFHLFKILRILPKFVSKHAVATSTASTPIMRSYRGDVIELSKRRMRTKEIPL